MRIFGYDIRKVRTNHNCLHPDHKTLVEFAFEIDGKEFFQFTNLFDMPDLRYQRIQEFNRAAEMRMTSEDLSYTFKKTRELLNKGEITEAVILQHKAESLTSQFIETDTFYQLFSCLFFDLDEDIIDYDYDYNKIKIELFKSQPVVSFFFSPPMRRYLPQIDISEQDLEVFLKQTAINKSEFLRTKIETIKNT